jgi:hypothetical protein
LHLQVRVQSVNEYNPAIVSSTCASSPGLPTAAGCRR